MAEADAISGLREALNTLNDQWEAQLAKAKGTHKDKLTRPNVPALLKLIADHLAPRPSINSTSPWMVTPSYLTTMPWRFFCALSVPSRISTFSGRTACSPRRPLTYWIRGACSWMIGQHTARAAGRQELRLRQLKA